MPGNKIQTALYNVAARFLATAQPSSASGSPGGLCVHHLATPSDSHPTARMIRAISSPKNVLAKTALTQNECTGKHFSLNLARREDAQRRVVMVSLLSGVKKSSSVVPMTGKRYPFVRSVSQATTTAAHSYHRTCVGQNVVGFDKSGM